LEALKGNRTGQYSIRVNDQFRVCFRWTAAGAEDAVTSKVWLKGGDGGTDLAEAVVKAAEKPSEFKFLYPLDWPIKKKIETIATKIYGADGVSYSAEAEKKIKLLRKKTCSNIKKAMKRKSLLSAD